MKRNQILFYNKIDGENQLEKFSKIDNVAVKSDKIDSALIKAFEIIFLTECLAHCQINSECMVVTFSNKKNCSLYDNNAFDYLRHYNDQVLYVRDKQVNFEHRVLKQNALIENIFRYNLQREIIIDKPQVFTEGLIHYWPFAGSTKDIIGGKDMNIVSKGYLTYDQYGNKDSGNLIDKKIKIINIF